MRGLLRFTRMTGDLVKAIRGCPQPVIAAIDGVCVGAGAMIATASDIRLGTPRAKVAFLFTRVGLVGLRHGRVRDAAADHRPGARGRAALHGPLDGRRGGRALGLLQPPGGPGRGRRGGARRVAGAGPDVRARDDQDDARPGVGHVARRRDRGRGAGAGDLHADPGLRARLPARSWPRSARSSRATDVLELAVLRGAPPRVRGVRARAPARRASRTTSTPAAAAFVRALARDGWLEHAVGEPLDVRTLCLARETLARHDGLADFAFAMQGLGQRADLAVRHRRPARALPAGGRGAGRRSRRSRSRSPTPAPTSRR